MKEKKGKWRMVIYRKIVSHSKDEGHDSVICCDL